jgi:hypothetical protein
LDDPFLDLIGPESNKDRQSAAPNLAPPGSGLGVQWTMTTLRIGVIAPSPGSRQRASIAVFSAQAVEVARIARLAAILLLEGGRPLQQVGPIAKLEPQLTHKRETTMMTRPGIWIWMITVMVLTGVGITAVLLLSPEAADVRLQFAIATLASGIAAIPISRTISKSMMAPAS